MLILKVLVVGLAYFLGSIPSSVWIGRYFYGVDVRDYGSGNAGFTNTVRTIGWKAGIPVFVIDGFKGWLAVKLAAIFVFQVPDTTEFINYQLILGIAAVVGHIFPIYVGFKGGKGVATLLGIILAIDPVPTLICFGIFMLVFFVTRYVSLSSLVAGLSYPILMIYIFHTTMTSLVYFSMIITILLFLTHQKNIERLIRNEESKAKLNRRKKNKDPDGN
jgi:acyl phosphate:glycerol-3-phosphate acyltransferase